jgi:hypothetical protein
VLARKSCGSALKFGVIAAGEGDLYPRFGTTMEWDTAAGQAVLEAAGGRVETFAGTPLAYGKPGFKNDGFHAGAAARRDKPALAFGDFAGRGITGAAKLRRSLLAAEQAGSISLVNFFVADLLRFVTLPPGADRRTNPYRESADMTGRKP